MSGHTGGRWMVYDKSSPPSGTFVNVCNVDSVAVVSEQSGDELGTTVADARLIAAAPELLEALQGFVSACDTAPPVEIVQRISAAADKARAAIAKATGAA